MGWNDVRISLVPTGWKLVAEIDRTSRTALNHQVSILHSEVAGEEAANRLSSQLFEELLKQEGFVVSQTAPSFLRMNRGEVEAFLVSEEGSLSEIILTFTLNRRSPSQIRAWQILVDKLTQAGKLYLVDRNTQEYVDGHKFLQLVVSSPAWKEFSRKRGWPSLIETTEIESVETATRSNGQAEDDNELAAEMLPIVEETWQFSEVA